MLYAGNSFLCVARTCVVSITIQLPKHFHLAFLSSGVNKVKNDCGALCYALLEVSSNFQCNQTRLLVNNLSFPSSEGGERE